MHDLQSSVDQAVQLLRQSQAVEAEIIFQRVLSFDPGHPDALHGLSVIAFQRGEKARAESLLRNLISEWPDRVIAQYDLACMLVEQGRDAEAQVLLEQVVSAAPEHASAWYQLGFVRKMQGRATEAEHAFRTCLSLVPGHASAANDLARVFRDRGDYAGALKIFEKAGRANVANPALHQSWSQFLSVSALPAKALSVLRRGLEKIPNDVDLRIGLAQALEGEGHREAAEREYRLALKLDPNRGLAIGGLLALLGSRAEQSLVDRAESILLDARARPPAKAVVGYGLGKVHHARNNYADAFRAWQVANEARQAEAGPLDREMLFAQVDETLRAFTAAQISRLRAWGSRDGRPVFIVGMPRSGTTLVEQIIASHPQAEGLGELPDLPIVAENFCASFGASGHWPMPDDVRDGAAITAAARHYLRALDFRLKKPARRLVDKAPLNFFNLGLVALLFPKAKIIWCKRDPRDVCLSIFSENFAPSQKYATALADLAVYCRQQDRLMHNWQKLLPGSILEVSYELLVSNQEETTRRLIGFLELDWSSRCLDFHEEKRSVQTPSRWQVRQPMYTSSLSRWKQYEPWLGPVLAEFGSLVQHNSEDTLV